MLALNHWAWAHPWAAHWAALIAQRGIFLLPLTAGGVALWPKRGYSPARRAVVAGVLSVAFAALFMVALGAVIDRPRPFVVLPIQPLFAHIADSSFPSDHALIGVAFVAPFLWRLPRVGGWLVLWAVAVGIARVAAGVHYPSDILGSAVLATFSSVLGLMAGSLLIQRLPPAMATGLGLERLKQRRSLAGDLPAPKP